MFFVLFSFSFLFWFFVSRVCQSLTTCRSMVRQSSSVVTAVAICLIVLIMHYVRVLFPRLMSGSTLAVCVPAMLDALVVLSRDEFEEIARQARYARAPVSYTSDSLLFLSLSYLPFLPVL